MYKFTNGVVVFDEKTKDKYVKAGMTLVKEEKIEVVKEKIQEVKEENDGKTSENSTKRDGFEQLSKRNRRHF